MQAPGVVIPPAEGGKHLDGAVEATGGHPASFKDPANPGFHAYAANRGLGACQGCHGEALDGVGGSTTVACTTCHGADFSSRCTACHGGVANATGAPPRVTWGQAGDPLRAGAHTKHVTAGTLSAAIPCATCHAVSADAFAAGHLGDGPAEVVLGGLAAASGATPGYARPAGTCTSTYCHGGYAGVHEFWFFEDPRAVPYAGANAAPAWTGGPMTCASCHGDPPATGTWHGSHNAGNQCELCHPDASGLPGAASITTPALHVNGVVDLAPRWRSTCFNCH
jgi:predicted CxxxxCH...CXXCH cytochrome family protein